MTFVLTSNQMEQLSAMISDKGLEAVLSGIGEITKQILLEKEGNTKTIVKKKNVICESVTIDNIEDIQNNEKFKDGMDFDILQDCIAVYKNTITNEKRINKSLKKKKIRLTNCPSHITENLAKFAIYKKYNTMPSWDTDKGDLVNNLSGKLTRLEVKGSINLFNGPPTFGPTEYWDKIYFVDCMNILKDIYTIYEVELSNESDIWKKIKVSNTQTFYDQCLQKRRPRISFEKLKNQLGNQCKIIFKGHISELKC